PAGGRAGFRTAEARRACTACRAMGSTADATAGRLRAGQRPGRWATLAAQPVGKEAPMRGVVLLVAAGPVLTAPAAPAPYLKKEGSKADLRRLQGTWDVALWTIEGEPADDLFAGAWQVVRGNRMTGYLRSGHRIGTDVLTLDPSRRPKAMDLDSGDGRVRKAV